MRFELDLIFQSSSFGSSREENRVSGLGQDFSLSPVEPTLTFFCIGSTGEWSFHVLGFLGFSVVAPVHQNLLTCIGSTGVTTGFAVLPVQPAYRISLTSV